MLHRPGVIRGAHARGAGLRVGLGLEEFAEVHGGGVGRLHRGVEVGARSRHPLAERGEVGRLVPEVAEPAEPEVPGVRSREVLLRLRQHPGNGPDPRRQLGGIRLGEGIVIGPEIDEPVHHRPFMGRHVALGREDLQVEARIARPRPPHPVVEVEPVHLGAQQVPVDLLGNRPALGCERIQPGAPRRQLGLLARHGRGGVVRNPVAELRPLESPPPLEQGDEVRVVAGSGGGRRGRFGPATGQDPGEEQWQEPHRNGHGRRTDGHGVPPGPAIVRVPAAACRKPVSG